MRGKVGILHSIGTLLAVTIGGAVLITGFLLMFIYSKDVKTEMTTMSQHYLHDLVISYGELMEEDVALIGLEKTLEVDSLEEHVGDVALEGMETSYAYVVSKDGTMLYHPTPEKIGEKVENAVVSGVVDKIAAGEKVESEVVEYDFKGTMKYAGYYVNESQDFILVVTVDEDEIMEPIKHIQRDGIVALFAAIIICGIFNIGLIIIRVIRPINNMANITSKVATMDFTENQDCIKMSYRQDEIGLMARSMLALRNELVYVVEMIRNSSEALVQAAEALNTGANDTNTTMEQVESAVNDIACGASSQAEETQQATEDVILIGEMVEDTTETVESLMQSAEQMREANEYAQNIIRELRAINQQSGEYIDIIAKQTDTTNESALKIGEATKIITSIAEETNLLSLNASIEAARAGEQGKGFAVVASEIQKLAEQSTESARQIEGIISMLLSDSEKAVETMRQVKDIIHEQTKHIVRTDEAFDKIQDGVTSSLTGMRKIAIKTEQLDKARVNVVDVVNNLTSIAEENAAATEETSASVVEVASIVTSIAEKAQSLNDIASELEEKMGVFQI